MKLIVAHQILIGSAVLLALLFGVRALVLASRGAPGPNLAIGVGSLIVGVTLALYFKKLRARALADKTPGTRAPRPNGSSPSDGR